MKKQKIALLLVCIVCAAFLAGACSLFGGGGDDDPNALPETKKRIYASTGENYITNVKDSSKLIRVSASLLLSKDSTELITQNAAGVRSIIIQTLREKTEEDLLAVSAIESLEAELTEQVRELLQLDEFIGVVISDYVVQ